MQISPLIMPFIVVIAIITSSPAPASYGSMKLDGLVAGLLLVVTLGYALLIGILWWFKVFRSRIMTVLHTLLSLVLTGLWIAVWRDAQHLINGIAKTYGSGIALFGLLAVLVMMVEVIRAPIAQYRAMRPRLRA